MTFLWPIPNFTSTHLAIVDEDFDFLLQKAQTVTAVPPLHRPIHILTKNKYHELPHTLMLLNI